MVRLPFLSLGWLTLEVLSVPRAAGITLRITQFLLGVGILLMHLVHDKPSCQPCSYANVWSYLRSNSLSTQPPRGKLFSHRLCRCTANTLLSLRSRPPPFARVKPPVQCPSLGSGSNGSGRRLSRRQAWPSEKQKGRIVNGRMPPATRRRQSRR